MSQWRFLQDTGRSTAREISWGTLAIPTSLLRILSRRSNRPGLSGTAAAIFHYTLYRDQNRASDLTGINFLQSIFSFPKLRWLLYPQLKGAFILEDK